MTPGAVVPGPPHELVAFWPITDHELTMDELITEALGELADVARETGAQVAGWPTWRRCPGHRMPGAGAYAEVLVCKVDAVPLERNRDRVRRRLLEAMS